jgi:hypothetical protein
MREMEGMTDTCTITKRAPKKKLSYDGGTVAFTIGRTVKGGTSLATGVIDQKSGTTATGYLVLTSVTGTFQNDEVLAEVAPGTGAAVVNGVISDYKNAYQQYEYTWSTDQSAVVCSFYSPVDPGTPLTTAGEVAAFSPKVMFLSTVTIAKDAYRVVSTVTGFTGTFDVIRVIPRKGPVSVGHYECDLKEVPA